MWITPDVELPDEILDAHERGDLVFFVGAGASRAAPSNLPLFETLAKRLGRLAGQSFSARGGLDYYIGQLEASEKGFDVRKHTAEIIANPRSVHNSLHAAIVTLADTGGSLRIVTTNYDDHLASAAKAESVNLNDTWYAPALPLGREFEGLVHLHGSVNRPANEIIISDRDFGRAYLTDAWATRFLTSMFSRRTTIFIGYSHDDAIMRYLALGLPSREGNSGPKRYAFTTDTENKKWKHLGVQPIRYEALGHDHTALDSALVAWASLAKMGQTDHESRMRTIVTGSTSLPRHDRDYLVSRLTTIDGARDFARSVDKLTDGRKLDWLTWMEGENAVKSLSNQDNPSGADGVLADWFAYTFVASPALNGAALQTVRHLRQTLSNRLFSSASWAANELRGKDVAASDKWSAILSTSIEGLSSPVVADALIRTVPDTESFSPLGLRAALRPFLKLEQPWYASEDERRTTPPRADLAWRSHESLLEQQIALGQNSSGSNGTFLLTTLEAALQDAYVLINSYRGPESRDTLTVLRAAIEPHEQNTQRGQLNAIINGLRDLGVESSKRIPGLPDRWWQFDLSIMRRLAIHLMSEDSVLAPDYKLEWLLDRCSLFETDLKHEAFRLLQRALPHISAESRERLLHAATATPGENDNLDPTRCVDDYDRYNLLVWLTRHDADWREARIALEEIQSRNPEFLPREHPDLNSWRSSGAWTAAPKIDVAEFITDLSTDTSRALAKVIEAHQPEDHQFRSSWFNTINLFREVAGLNPDIARSAWDALAAVDIPDGTRIDLQLSMIEGFGDAKLDPDDTDVVSRAQSMLAAPDAPRAIGRFLAGQIRMQIGSDESALLISMRALASELWQERIDGFEHDPKADPLGIAPLYLNSWPGSLAQYWSSEVERRWRQCGDEWEGLSKEESNAVEQLLNAEHAALDATQPAIAAEVYFFFAADPAFASEHIFPLFDSSDRHAFAWQPFLHRPRWDNKFLAAGFLTLIRREIDRVHELPDSDSQRSFFMLLTSVVSYAEIPSRSRLDLLGKTVLAKEQEYTSLFAEVVYDFINNERVNGVEIWRRWLRNHLKRRLKGVPRIASSSELTYWADVVPLLGDSMPPACRLFDEHNVGLSERSVFRDLPTSMTPDQSRLAIRFLANRVRNTFDDNATRHHDILALIESVSQSFGEYSSRPIVDAALDTGLISPSIASSAGARGGRTGSGA